MKELAFIGLTFSFLGKAFIAYAALQVHHRFQQEHKIDEVVFKEMGHEKKVGFLGIGFLILGYILEAYSLLQL